MIRLYTPFTSRFYQPAWATDIVLTATGGYSVFATCHMLTDHAADRYRGRLILRVSHNAPAGVSLSDALMVAQRCCSREVWLAHQEIAKAEFKAKALDWYKHPSPKLKRYWRELAEQAAARFQSCS